MLLTKTRHISFTGIVLTAVSLFLLSAAGDGSIYARAIGGLRFSSSPENTSLDLFSGRRKSFTGETSIGFDMKIFNQDAFGQILAIDIPGNPFILTLVSRHNEGPMLVMSSQNDRDHFVEIPYGGHADPESEWKHIRLSLCPDDEAIYVSAEDSVYVLDNVVIPRKFKMNVIFGGSGNASVVESPEMAVRQVVVSGGSRSMIFPLDEVSGNAVHQRNGSLKGRVTSPRWLVYDHHFWEKGIVFQADKAAGIAYDEVRDRIVIVDKDSLKFVDFRSGKCRLSRIPVFSGPLPAGYSGEAMYDSVRDVIYFYNLIDHGNVAMPFFAQIRMDGKVDYVARQEFGNPLHHHAYAFFPESRDMYIFGGYGNYIYSDRMFRFDFGSRSWQEVVLEGEHIAPRMHTVAGRLADGRMLIFGGVGNETGRQELGKDFFYDLYAFDRNTNSVTRLWNIEESGRYVPTRNVVPDEENGCIYVFCRDRRAYASLKRFDLKTGQSETVSNELFYPTNDIVSSYYLFADRSLNVFYLVNRHSDGDSSSITVFRLKAPPVPMSYLQKNGMDSTVIFPVAVAGLFLLAALAAAAVLIRRKRKSVEDNGPDEPEDNVHPRMNAVIFFGEFTVYDREGNVISEKFGSKLKQLLACIMIWTENYGGISSRRLSSAVWPEKTMSEAKGTRGVSINHLRALLKNIDGIDIVFENDKWRTSVSPEFYWDYHDAKRLSDELLADGFSVPGCRKFISILGNGPLLPGLVQYQWFDSIKVDSEEVFFKTAEKMLDYLYEGREYKLAVKCADILLSIDCFNAAAVQFKVDSLRRMGKPELAKQVKARFEEDMKMYGK